MADRTRTKPLVLKGLRWQQIRKRFRVRQQGPVTALEVDGPVLRAVHTALRGSRAVVVRIVAERLDLPRDADRSDPVVVGKALGRALDRARLKPAQVAMAVPRASVVLRTLNVPVLTDVRELASIVHFQVGRDLPFRADDAVIDFKVRRQVLVPAGGEGNAKPDASDAEPSAQPPPATPKLEVLIAAVKREVVEFYQQTAAAAGLRLSALGLLSQGNARCLEACEATPENDEAVGLVSLRPDEVGIDIIAQQSLLFSRGAPAKPRPEPSPAPAAPADAPIADTAAKPNGANGDASGLVGDSFTDLVLIEVIRSLASYGGMEPNIPVAKLVIAGATGQEAAVADALQRRLNIPCSLLDPAKALELPKAAREHAAGASAAIGLALGVNDSQGLALDFLNPKRPAVQRNVRRVRIVLGAAMAAAAVVCLLCVRAALINRHMKPQLEATQALEQEYRGAGGRERPIYRKAALQTLALKEWGKEARNWLDHYAYVSVVLPPSDEVYVSSFSVGAQGALRLSVQAHNSQILDKLNKQLRDVGYEVKPQAVTPGTDRHGYDFRSDVTLIVPEKMKVDVAKMGHPPARPADDTSLEPAGKAPRRGGGS